MSAQEEDSTAIPSSSFSPSSSSFPPHSHHYAGPATASCDLIFTASGPDDHHHHHQVSHTLNSPHGLDMTSQDALNHPGLSAFAAVSHYPYAVTSEPDYLSVSEVVNAVIDREHFFPDDAGQDRAQSYRSGRYSTPFFTGGSRRRTVVDDDGEVDGRRRWTTVEDAGSEAVMSPSWGNRLSPPEEDDDDDLDDMRKFYPDARNYEEPGGSGLSSLTEVDYAGFYHMDEDEDQDELDFDYDSTSQSEDLPIAQEMDFQNGDSGDAEDENVSGGEVNGNGQTVGVPVDEFPVTTYERNFTIDQFVEQWIYQSNPQVRNQLFVPPYRTSTILSINRPEKVIRPPGKDRMDFFDLQQIPWWETLRAKRADARTQRDLWYRPYHNVNHSPHEAAKAVRQHEYYFREKAMYTKHRASIEHFQLRNLMSVPAYNTVHFASESRLYSWVPAYDDLTCLIDLSRPTRDSVLEGPVKISTMKTAHGVSIVGGFSGEYAMRAEGNTPGIQGYVTRDLNGITNHIDIVPNRTNHSPTGIFASNDNHLRILDCETDTFTADYNLSRAVNCTSTSPDARLRVVVGDSPEAIIIEADTGRPVQSLRGHRDFGFACAWSPDMLHIATGNQDKTTIIWDVRMWKPLTMLAADIAGYRSLRFSPVGGGPRTLLMTEPADRISIVNAQTFASRQVHDFFGEIAGADYTPDGGGVWVANSDENYGGFMEFERRQWGQRFGPGGLPNEWVGEGELEEDQRCVVGSERERQMRFLGNLSEEEHDMLLV